MKFDFIIGNPPYQEETKSDSTRKPPIYNVFMDQAYSVADCVELITPARFLFNAGYTPKAWNEKMLNDHHFLILYYEPDSRKIFPDAEIKGGIVISYKTSKRTFTPIEIFTKFAELNSILSKIRNNTKSCLSSIIFSPLNYKLSKVMLDAYPNCIGRLRSSAFITLKEIFYDEKPEDAHIYIKMVGLINGKRAIKFVRKDYIDDNGKILDKFSVLLAKANGDGKFGEQLSPSLIASPNMAYTQTFICIGAFNKKIYAENLSKYIKTKFTRSLLGVLKITQDCPGPKWKYVPLQDFTERSDIDWSKSVSEIDQQLYAKYGLDPKEIDFIETHVKEMA